MTDDGSLSPRRPLPNLPPLSSTHKPKSLKPIMMGPSTLGDLSDIEDPEIVQTKKKRRKRKVPRASAARSGRSASADNEDESTRNEESTNRTEESNTNEESQRSSARSRRKSRKTSRPVDGSPPGGGKGDFNLRVHRNFALSPIIQEDDIQESINVREMRTIKQIPDASKGTESHKNDTVYIQTQKGFKGRKTKWVQRRKEDEARKAEEMRKQMMGEEKTNPAITAALATFRIFDIITYFFYSMLPGLSIANIWFIIILRQKGLDNFFEQYADVAQDIHIMYKVVLSLCLLSALDRFDLSNHGIHIFRRLAVADPKAWMVLVYFTCWLLECIITKWSIWMETNNPLQQSEDNLYSNGTLNSNYMNENPTENYDIWFSLNLVKSIFLLFGWLLLSASKSKNNTVENLYSNKLNTGNGNAEFGWARSESGSDGDV